MSGNSVVSVRPLHIFSREKVDEFRDMSLRARLIWLEEANALADRVLGTERRAVSDERFRNLPVS